MEKKDITELLEQFDEFVELSLQKKNSQPAPTDTNSKNQVDKYQYSMEKRLKLKPTTHQ